MCWNRGVKKNQPIKKIIEKTKPKKPNKKKKIKNPKKSESILFQKSKTNQTKSNKIKPVQSKPNRV